MFIHDKNNKKTIRNKGGGAAKLKKREKNPRFSNSQFKF